MTEEKKEPAATPAPPPEERPELQFTVKVVGKTGGVFEATATCTLEGHPFTGRGVNAGAEAGHAIASSIAAVVQEMSARWHRLQSFGGDVVIKKSRRSLADALERLFRPLGVPPGWPPAGYLLPSRPGRPGGAVFTGELLDPDVATEDDEDDDVT